MWFLCVLVFCFSLGDGGGVRVVVVCLFFLVFGGVPSKHSTDFCNDYIDVANNFKRKSNNSGSSTVIHLDR